MGKKIGLPPIEVGQAAILEDDGFKGRVEIIERELSTTYVGFRVRVLEVTKQGPSVTYNPGSEFDIGVVSNFFCTTVEEDGTLMHRSGQSGWTLNFDFPPATTAPEASAPLDTSDEAVTE